MDDGFMSLGPAKNALKRSRDSGVYAPSVPWSRSRAQRRVCRNRTRNLRQRGIFLHYRFDSVLSEYYSGRRARQSFCVPKQDAATR